MEDQLFALQVLGGDLINVNSNLHEALYIIMWRTFTNGRHHMHKKTSTDNQKKLSLSSAIFVIFISEIRREFPDRKHKEFKRKET